MLNDVVADVTAEELREFLEADELGAQADPVFKERLRRKLWCLVRTQVWRGPMYSDEDA